MPFVQGCKTALCEVFPQVRSASLRDINSPNSRCRLITPSWIGMICFSSLLEVILPKLRSRQGVFPLAGLAVWTQFHLAIISESEQGWVYNCAGVISSRRLHFLSKELSSSARLLRVWDAAVLNSGGIFVLGEGMPKRRRPGGFLLIGRLDCISDVILPSSSMPLESLKVSGFLILVFMAFSPNSLGSLSCGHIDFPGIFVL